VVVYYLVGTIALLPYLRSPRSVVQLAVPLGDPALVVALMIGVRGGRLMLDVDS
jgi:hypothetical protein